jgi:hypothetical protein
MGPSHSGFEGSAFKIKEGLRIILHSLILFYSSKDLFVFLHFDSRTNIFFMVCRII